MRKHALEHRDELLVALGVGIGGFEFEDGPSVGGAGDVMVAPELRLTVDALGMSAITRGHEPVEGR